MHFNRKEIVLLFFSFPFMPSSMRASATLVVGNQTTCPGATFSQIQTAINQASPNDSIHVCPGVYVEQLAISKSLHINADPGAFVVPPVFNQNATGLSSGVPIAAGILVSNADAVSITGLTVDGINSAITQCSPRLEGIYYQNASGKIDHVVVRNMRLGPGLGGCQSGTGILVESGGGGGSNVEIVNCSIYNFQKNGITANEVRTRVSVHGNTVTGIGPTTGAAQNGVQVGFGATGEIIQNTVVNMIWSPCTDPNTCQAVATNILIAETDGVDVRANIVSISQVGIFADGNNEIVAGNQVSNSAVFEGIRVEGNESKILNNSVTT